MVQCASDGKESKSGEAMFCGEVEAGAEVKAGGEDEASGTGGAVDARFKADRVHAAFMGLAQGPGWAAVAGDAVGCLGGEATSEGRVWCGGGGNERLGEGGGEGWFQNNCYWYLPAHELPASSYACAVPSSAFWISPPLPTHPPTLLAVLRRILPAATTSCFGV